MCYRGDVIDPGNYVSRECQGYPSTLVGRQGEDSLLSLLSLIRNRSEQDESIDPIRIMGFVRSWERGNSLANIERVLWLTDLNSSIDSLAGLHWD